MTEIRPVEGRESSPAIVDRRPESRQGRQPRGADRAGPNYVNKGRGCVIHGCGKAALARGYCGTHYYRWRTHGDPRVALHVDSYGGAECRVEGCGRTAKCRHLCMKHYSRLIRRGAESLEAFPEISRLQVQLLAGPKGGRSRYKGVSYRPKAGKWRASIRKGGDRYFLGEFPREDDAARAYNAAAERLFPGVPKYLNPV